LFDSTNGLAVAGGLAQINQSEAFAQAGAAIIRYDEAESAAALAEALLQEIDVPAERIDAIVSSVRNELAPIRRGLSAET
jgi:hypothetical protein